MEIRKIINVFTFYSLIFMLRVLSSAMEPAVRFLQTLPTGCYNLQQDVVDKNSHFEIKSGGLLIRFRAGATCIYDTVQN